MTSKTRFPSWGILGIGMCLGDITLELSAACPQDLKIKTVTLILIYLQPVIKL